MSNLTCETEKKNKFSKYVDTFILVYAFAYKAFI